MCDETQKPVISIIFSSQTQTSLLYSNNKSIDFDFSRNFFEKMKTCCLYTTDCLLSFRWQWIIKWQSLLHGSEPCWTLPWPCVAVRRWQMSTSAHWRLTDLIERIFGTSLPSPPSLPCPTAWPISQTWDPTRSSITWAECLGTNVHHARRATSCRAEHCCGRRYEYHPHSEKRFSSLLRSQTNSVAFRRSWLLFLLYLAVHLVKSKCIWLML